MIKRKWWKWVMCKTVTQTLLNACWAHIWAVGRTWPNSHNIHIISPILITHRSSLKLNFCIVKYFWKVLFDNSGQQNIQTRFDNFEYNENKWVWGYSGSTKQHNLNTNKSFDFSTSLTSRGRLQNQTRIIIRHTKNPNTILYLT